MRNKPYFKRALRKKLTHDQSDKEGLLGCSMEQPHETNAAQSRMHGDLEGSNHQHDGEYGL